MVKKYTYKKTKHIEKLLQRLEILKGVFEGLPVKREKEEQLQRLSLLKSSLFSARIEGNKLRFEDLTPRGLERQSKEKEKIEIHNIYHALQFIRSERFPQRITIPAIQDIHAIVMRSLSSDAGSLRHEPSAIFNQAGVAVYMSPPPSEIQSRLHELIRLANSSSNPAPVNAALTHFHFEKIHPFLDGNGRVGRILSVRILRQEGYDFRGLLSWEERLEEMRDEYYHLLDIPGSDITMFVEFFLELLTHQAEAMIQSLKNTGEESEEDTLLPRRREILEVIRDHPNVSFDFIRRRFLRVAESTLHYDIKQLLKAGLIRKLGSTRGVVYAPK